MVKGLLIGFMVAGVLSAFVVLSAYMVYRAFVKEAKRRSKESGRSVDEEMDDMLNGTNNEW